MAAELPGRDQVLSAIERILREDCLVEAEIAPEVDLQTDLGLDSLGLLTLIAELENDFRVTLEEIPEPPPTTVDGVIDLVLEHLARAGRDGAGDLG